MTKFYIQKALELSGAFIMRHIKNIASKILEEF